MDIFYDRICNWIIMVKFSISFLELFFTILIKVTFLVKTEYLKGSFINFIFDEFLLYLIWTFFMLSLFETTRSVEIWCYVFFLLFFNINLPDLLEKCRTYIKDWEIDLFTRLYEKKNPKFEIFFRSSTRQIKIKMRTIKATKLKILWTT